MASYFFKFENFDRESLESILIRLEYKKKTELNSSIGVYVSKDDSFKINFSSEQKKVIHIHGLGCDDIHKNGEHSRYYSHMSLLIYAFSPCKIVNGANDSVFLEYSK